MNEVRKIVPNKDQEIGIDKIKKFLKSSDRIFRLVGAAGTGKTTMIKLALEGYNLTSERPDVVGITLTHKAKRVLRNSIPTSTTFADAFAYREHIDNHGRRTFKPADKKYLYETPLGLEEIPVFVYDEISMITHEMLKIIMKETSIFSKIILMGDKFQLPPIGKDMKKDEDSPVFHLDLPDSCSHVLTERVRQGEGNPILDLSDVIIDEIKGSKNINRVVSEILKPRLDSKGKGYLVKKYDECIQEYFNNRDYENEKIIGYRNEKFVYPVNDAIRRMVFPDSDKKLEVGDYIFMTNNFRYRDEERAFKIENAEEFYIKNINVVNKLFRFANTRIESYQCLIGGRFFYVPTESGQEDYDHLYSELETNKDWKNLYALKDSFADYTMGYAINAYRCQGSTYRNVYVDLSDILSVSMLTDKRKLQTLYTAITRPTDKVIFMQK